jgi:ADP-ribosylglycohydrolase
MRGAIIGDINGSTHEFMYRVNSKDFELFPPDSTFTDDTVLTIAEYRVLEDIGKEYCLIKVKENLDEMVEYLGDYF